MIFKLWLNVQNLQNSKLVIVILILQFMSLTAANSQEKLVIGGSGTDLATFRILAAEYKRTSPQTAVVIPPSLGSSGAVKAVNAGKLDIGLLSRKPKKKEMASGIISTQYATTPLVFAVSNKSEIQNVSIKDIADIYSGKRKKWQNGSVVRPILRPRSDSDMKILHAHYDFMGSILEQTYQRKGITIAITDQDSAEKIAHVPGALGTSTLALILSERRPLKPLILDGVSSDTRSPSGDNYPLKKELFFVTKPEVSAKIKHFITFLASKNARRILQETGHSVVTFSK